MGKTVLNILSVVFLVLYPFAIFFGLQHFSPRYVSILLIVMLVLRFCLRPEKADRFTRISAAALFSVGLVILALTQMSNDALFIRLYPFLMSMFLLAIFAYTLKKKPSMIERFARVMHKDLPDEAIGYLEKVTMVWCAFFFLNGLIALYTTLYASLETWVWYNGFVSYIVIGILFVGEFLVRKIVAR